MEYRNIPPVIATALKKSDFDFATLEKSEGIDIFQEKDRTVFLER